MAQRKSRMNVLLIAIDDMRPELGCYGAKHVHSPNIDRLASTGTVFTRAYCQQAVCSPSRTSLLTGLRPDTTKVYDLQTHFRGTIPQAVTLPEAFKNAGYQTTGLSKIFHGGLDDGQSWTIPWWRPGGAAWNSEENARAAEKLEARLKQSQWKIAQNANARGSRPPSWSAPDVADDELPDGQTANQAVACLRALKDKPFFLATGFLKPHLPFIAPKKYHDLYPEAAKIELPDYPEDPSNLPPWAKHDNGELRTYGDIGQNEITTAKARELVRAYYAAISYTDAQIGKVLAELDRLGLRENTAIVLFGDHGWHLNNHGLWHKHTVFEKATRSLLVASVPGQKKRGTRCDALVEFVDILPSLCEAASVKAPASLAGRSFVPLLDDPAKKWKEGAVSQYPRVHQGQRLMGYSLRTARYRYTEWRKREGAGVLARELYDYQVDPNESANRAGDPANAGLMKKLAEQLAGVAGPA